MKFITACDPGASGGFAWFEEGKGVQTAAMPDTDEGKLELVRRIHKANLIEDDWHVYIEQVGGFIAPPKIERKEDGSVEVLRTPGSHMFNFGENAGLVRGMFLALGATVELVPPKRWQAPLMLKKGKATTADWKRTLKNAAQRKFPNIKVTLKTADALLILSYATLRNPSSNTNIAEGQSKRATAEPEWQETAIAPPIHIQTETPSLYVMSWKGEKWVFKGDDGNVSLVRKATAYDTLNLPSR